MSPISPSEQAHSKRINAACARLVPKNQVETDLPVGPQEAPTGSLNILRHAVDRLRDLNIEVEERLNRLETMV